MQTMRQCQAIINKKDDDEEEDEEVRCYEGNTYVELEGKVFNHGQGTKVEVLHINRSLIMLLLV
ncbi:hypothetical protein V6Z11_D06G180700 [Gossypium hirsutum]